MIERVLYGSLLTTLLNQIALVQTHAVKLQCVSNGVQLAGIRKAVDNLNCV